MDSKRPAGDSQCFRSGTPTGTIDNSDGGYNTKFGHARSLSGLPLANSRPPHEPGAGGLGTSAATCQGDLNIAHTRGEIRFRGLGTINSNEGVSTWKFKTR